MLLTPEILTLDILNVIFLLFGTIAFYFTVRIVHYYDAKATTSLQYKLEKESYLVATIIKFIFTLKIPLFIFFIFTLDKISTILPGAMCATGVVTATSYGTPLLLLKIVNLYLFGYWIVLNNEDMKFEDRRYLRLKFIVFGFAYFLLVSEILLQFVMFFSIDVSSVVDCCGAIFSTTNGTYLSELIGAKHLTILGFFYGTFFLIVLSYIRKENYLFSLLHLFYLIISIVSLIAFFGTYIYELPTHHCPFCLLQKDYDYVGYFLYIFLFLGTFYGIILGVIPFEKRERLQKFTIAILFDTLYMLGVSYFPVAYYLKNGVWL